MRNRDGRMYGSHGFSPSPLSLPENLHDYIYADWRLLYFKGEKAETPDGAGIMESIVGARLPVAGKDLSSPTTELVFNHNLSGFSTDRDTYLLFRFSDDNSHSLVQHLAVGRLIPAFGLRTDEHRTYTRDITQTSWNDLVMGVQLSGDPFETSHYDFSIINGDSIPTTNQIAPDKSNKWGGLVNLRWTSPTDQFPFIFGASGFWADRLDGHHSGAESAYFLTSIERWTTGRLPLILSFEFVRARQMNSGNPDLLHYVDSSYLSNVAETSAQALSFQMDWLLSNRWVLTYKLDEMILDINYPADYYRRHGVGFRHRFAANADFMARYEWAIAMPTIESDHNSLASQNAFWGVVRVSF